MDDVGGVIKSGTLANVTDMVKKLAGPALEELGAIFGDKVSVYRIKNFIEVTEKTKRMLENAGLEAKSVPGRLLLPIFDACSVEENDDLQERWAGLLASASQESDSLSPSFIETLKQLTPKEAKHWDYIIVELSKLHKRDLMKDDGIPYEAFSKAWGAPLGMSDTGERLGLIRREYNVEMETHTRHFRSSRKTIRAHHSSLCSSCGRRSSRVHSRYWRSIADLPWEGIPVGIMLWARKLLLRRSVLAPHPHGTAHKAVAR